MKKGRNFFPVGSTFEWRKFIFRVEESEGCRDCWFKCETKFSCTGIFHREIPSCVGLGRQDGKSVRFVKVGEVAE